MRIFYSDNGDPMLLDTPTGLCFLSHDLKFFLERPDEELVFDLDTNGTPAPYSEFLKGLRVRQLPDKLSPRIAIDERRTLNLALSAESLERLRRLLAGIVDGEHFHVYGEPLSLVVEADSNLPDASEA